MKGILVFYINYHPDEGETASDCINFVHNQNLELIEALAVEADYRVMFVPTTHEACRVVKVDFATDTCEEIEAVK